MELFLLPPQIRLQDGYRGSNSEILSHYADTFTTFNHRGAMLKFEISMVYFFRYTKEEVWQKV